jgi:hypothetical protein
MLVCLDNLGEGEAVGVFRLGGDNKAFTGMPLDFWSLDSSPRSVKLPRMTMMSGVNVTGQLEGTLWLRNFQYPATIVDATILSRGGYDYGIVWCAPKRSKMMASTRAQRGRMRTNSVKN